MLPRDGGYACYQHRPPYRWRPPIEVPPVKWAPGQPSALSLIGQDVDVEWHHDPANPKNDGYVVVAAKERHDGS